MGAGVFRAGALERAAGRVVPAQALSAPPDGMPPIKMAPDRDTEPRARPPARLLGQLQWDGVEGDDVVEADGALFLVTQDAIQVRGAERDEGRGRIGGQATELCVVVR